MHRGRAAECRVEKRAGRFAADDELQRMTHAMRSGLGVAQLGIGGALFGERQPREQRSVAEHRFGAPVGPQRRPQEISCGGDCGGRDAAGGFAGCGRCHCYTRNA